MKKVISLATTAAMTLSVLSVPAIICAAEAAAPASVAMADQTIVKGLTKFTVPVTATKAGTITSAEFELSAEMYIAGKYKAVIKGVESKVDGLEAALADNKVTVTGSADVTRGQALVEIAVEIQDNLGNAASSVPENTIFVLNVNSATVNGAAETVESPVLFVEAADATEGASLKIDNINTVVKGQAIEVPVYLNGAYGAINTRFTASNGATVKVKEAADGFDISTDGKGFIFAPLSISEELENRTFTNEKVATLEVTLPEDAVSGQSFEITTKFFDASTVDKKAVKLEAAPKSDVVYVLRGDANLSNELEQIDATLILKEVLSLDVKQTSLLPTEYTEVAAENDIVKETIDRVGMDRLVEAASNAVDNNSDGSLSAIDATYLLKYLLAVSVKDYPETFDTYLTENV